MGQTADQLRDQIEHQREELGNNLQQLEEKVKSTVDWRTQFEQKPWAGVGVAFAGGFLLSMLMPSGGGSSSKSSETQSASYMANYRVMDDSQRWGQIGSSGTSGTTSSGPAMGFSSGGSQQKSSSPEMSEITETLENIRGAVMGLAATRLRGFLAEAVPGFEDEYEQARTRRGASTSSKIDSSSSSSGSSSMSSQSQGSGGSGGSSAFASTGSPSGGASGSGGSSSSMTATTPPSQTHDADTPLAGYMGSTEGTATSQPNDSYRS